MHVNRSAHKSFAVENPLKLQQDMQTAFNKLKTKRKMGCPRRVVCDCRVTRPSVISRNAGQAFETLPLDKLYEALGDVTLKFQKKMGLADPSVSVTHGPRARTCDGGLIRDKVEGRTSLFIARILACVASVLGMRRFLIGNKISKQLRGVPIGGPLSSPLQETLLGFDEDNFKNEDWVDIAKVLGITGSFEEWVLALRYVDDLNGLS